MYICRYTLSNYDFVLDNSIFCNWMQTRRSDSWYHRSCNCYRSNSAPLHHEKIRRIKCGTANTGRNRRYTCLTAYNGYKPVRNWSGSWISKSNHSSNKHSIQLSCNLRIGYVQFWRKVPCNIVNTYCSFVWYIVIIVLVLDYL